MTQFLPPNLLALFAPRDPIPYMPPAEPLTWEKDRLKSPYTGIGQHVNLFEEPKDTPPPTRGEKKAEKQRRRVREKAEQRSEAIVEELKAWDPHNDPNATGDAFKTLFVGRINYDTTESKLRREFEMYGKIRKIHMVKNMATGNSRGYAFVEYEKERDMHAAYKSADGKKIDGKRVLVDVERGRTVKGWRPRRLGGGLGSTRAGPDDEKSPRDRDDKDKDRREVRKSTERPRIDRERRHRSRERDRDRDRARDRDRGEPEREKRKDRDRDRRDRDKDRDRRDRDKKRDGDRKERRKEEGVDGESGKKEERSRESRHRHRDRSRERDGSRRDRDRDRDRHRERGDRERSGRDAKPDPGAIKMDTGGAPAQGGVGDFHTQEGQIKQEMSDQPRNNYEQGYYGGPDGDAPNERKDNNGYYNERKYKDQMDENSLGRKMEEKEDMYTEEGQY